MTDTIIHVGDVGTIFRVTVVETDGVTAIPVDTATEKKIYFQKSDGTRVVQDAEFVTDGSDGKIQYVSQTGDVDISGTWLMQGYVEIAEGKFFSEAVRFLVHDTLYIEEEGPET